MYNHEKYSAFNRSRYLPSGGAGPFRIFEMGKSN